MASLAPEYLMHPPTRRRWTATAVVGMLAASGIALSAAPLLMPDSYSWLRHVVSETASQGTADAWVTRSAFVLAGTAVVALATTARAAWGPLGFTLHTLYGILVVGLAVFSRRPWTGGPFDPFEDSVHSGTAIVAGVIFTVAILAVALRRSTDLRSVRLLDGATFGAMVICPLIMLTMLGVAGLAERVMVTFGLAWYMLEAMSVIRSG